MGKQKNKLHFRRFEFKYLLAPEVARAIKDDINHFLKPDLHTKEKESSSKLRSGNQGYWVSTVYLDNDKLACFREKNDGLFARKKVRFRVYGKKRNSAVFLELKRKRGDVILKDRLVVKKKQVPLILEATLDYLFGWEKKKNGGFEVMKEYVIFKEQRRLKPVVLVTYFRQAFISDYENLRLTIDSQIKASHLKDFSFSQDSDREKDLLDKATVLELKFTGSLPYWLYHLLKKYNLKRQSFSKYCRGVEAVLNTAF